MAENEGLSVFLTSGTDALARELTRQLVAEGHQVASVAHGLDEAATIREDGGLPVYCDVFRAGEIASTLRMIEADAIVNTATQGVNSFPPYKPDWDYYQRLLAEGTSAMLEAAAQTDVKYIVHLSYTFLYGDKHGEWVDEHASLETDDALFEAAAHAEQAVLAAETPACVLRAGHNYGPNSGVMLALREGLHNSSSLPLGDEHQAANWVHTADLVAAVKLALEKQPQGEIFNIADESPVSPGEFADYFAEQFGVQKPGRQRLPSVFAQIMQAPSLRALLAASAKAKTDKAREVLGWQPQHASYHQGIEQALLAWRAHS
ncbi:MAG: NAD-dependent epimerase/dehydratase family protein [Anaerolineae bacterium]|nr:NAD-dependent epimerase/dehydratase family protein [Anaerolineae bacterium]